MEGRIFRSRFAKQRELLAKVELTFVRIPCAPDWLNQLQTGLTKERSFTSIARDLL